MLRKCLEKLLTFVINAVVGTIVGLLIFVAGAIVIAIARGLGPVLLCDVWQLRCWICR